MTEGGPEVMVEVEDEVGVEGSMMTEVVGRATVVGVQEGVDQQ
jgi:hypothetical protein